MVHVDFKKHIFVLEVVWGTFSKTRAIFFLSSGHSDLLFQEYIKRDTRI